MIKKIYKSTDKEFIQAVKTSKSIREALIKLNLKPAGGNYKCFHLRVKELNVSIEHFTDPKEWNRGRNFGPKRSLEEYLNGVPIQSNKLKKRLIKEGLKEHRCECCGLNEWLGEPIPLELDHINGDHYNNMLENLKVLCPNCHAKTPTYRGKNIRNKSSKTIRTKTETIRTKKIYKCSSCEVELKTNCKTGLCNSCYSKSQRKVERPSKEQLLQEVKESSYLAVGKKYGVSDNSIRKWINK